MDHIQSVRAALKASAPVVAIPVEGHAPVCIKAKLLKGALKGVYMFTSVEVLENRSLRVQGYTALGTRTSATFAPMARYEALRQIRDWTIKEREKRIRVITQGVLSAEAQRAMKKAKIEAEAGNALKDAQKAVENIYRDARAHVNPKLIPAIQREREMIVDAHRAYRDQQGIRKRGSVILWRLKELRKELEQITVKKGPKHGPKKTFARKAALVPRVFVVTQTISSLEKQFKSLCPPVKHEWKDQGYYYTDPWIDKRPKDLPYQVINGTVYKGVDQYDRKAEAVELKEARGTIKALTPPEDELIAEQIAA